MSEIVKIKKQPKTITPALLECVIMPNGEVISLGVSLGFYGNFIGFLYEKKELKI